MSGWRLLFGCIGRFCASEQVPAGEMLENGDLDNGRRLANLGKLARTSPMLIFWLHKLLQTML